MQTDTASFDGHDFVVLAHAAKSHQHGNERAKGSKVVHEIGRQIAKIIDDNEESDVVACDVVEQLEEGKSLKQKDEHGHDESEINGEAAKNVNVHKPGDAAARNRLLTIGVGTRGAVKRLTELTNGGGSRARFTTQKTQQRSDRSGRVQPPALAAKLFHTWQQHDAEGGKNQIRHPDANCRWDGALPSESSTGNEKKVISRDHGYGD